jgi:signal transduction histidine kinase
MELTEKFGLDEQERIRRLEFLGLGEEDARQLQSIHGMANRSADDIIDRLYDHLLKFEPMREFFRNPETLARVKDYQKRYFTELTEGRTDEKYFENRLRVGDTHQRIELLPQWYLGLYSRYFQLIIEQVRDSLGSEKALDVIPALTKQMFLDIGLALDSYIQGGFIDTLRAERRVSSDLREELARKEKLAIIGQLGGGVGHELRNPIAAMKVSIYFLKMALEGNANPKVQRHLELLDSELQGADETITNLLDFSRVRQAEQMVASAADIVRDVMARHDVRSIEFVEELQDLKVVVDPGQIRQVIGNLVTNALQAMPNGGRLTIRVYKNVSAVHIDVSDTGTGMTAETLAKIFQPLFTTKAKGIGLGLSVCDSLIQANGGRIRVASAPGQGSTFTVELPAVESR